MLKNFFLSIRENSKRRRRLLFAVIGILVLSFILFSDTGVINRFTLEQEKKELKHKIEEAEKETDSLKKRMKMLQSEDDEIERVAREKYGMKKKGEEIYLIERDTENKSE